MRESFSFLKFFRKHWGWVALLVPLGAVILFYSYVRFGAPNCIPIFGNAADPQRVPRLAMIGSAFAILGTYFSGLAFIALIATLLVQKEQVESTLRTMEANSSFQTLASFQVRVAELIGKSDKNILDDFSNVQVEIKAHMMASRSIQANDNLLHSLSDIRCFPIS